MRRLLSGKYSRSIFWQRVLGGLVGLGIGMYVLLRIFELGIVSKALAIFAAISMVLAVTAAMTKSGLLLRGLKQVSADDQFLFVADSPNSEEIAIPLSEVSRVTQWRGRGLRPVMVEFRSPTKFGDRIRFQPAIRQGESLNGLRENLVVAELRALVKQ